MKVKHDLLLIVSQENQKQTTTFSLESTRNKTRAQRCDIRVLFVAQCTLVKEWRSALWLNAMHSVKSDEFENSYPLLYIFLTS